MEGFRPLIVDSSVITAINTGMVTSKDFARAKAACVLTDRGRKAFILRGDVLGYVGITTR
jgi:CRISPR-associated protein Cas1